MVLFKQYQQMSVTRNTQASKLPSTDLCSSNVDLLIPPEDKDVFFIFLNQCACQRISFDQNKEDNYLEGACWIYDLQEIQ